MKENAPILNLLENFLQDPKTINFQDLTFILYGNFFLLPQPDQEVNFKLKQLLDSIFQIEDKKNNQFHYERYDDLRHNEHDKYNNPNQDICNKPDFNQDRPLNSDLNRLPNEENGPPRQQMDLNAFNSNSINSRFFIPERLYS